VSSSPWHLLPMASISLRVAALLRIIHAYSMTHTVRDRNNCVVDKSPNIKEIKELAAHIADDWCTSGKVEYNASSAAKSVFKKAKMGAYLLKSPNSVLRRRRRPRSASAATIGASRRQQDLAGAVSCGGGARFDGRRSAPVGAPCSPTARGKLCT